MKKDLSFNLFDILTDIEYDKGLMRYTGQKVSLMPQIVPLLPKDIDTFYDIFGGGGSVSVNVIKHNLAKKTVCQDVNNYYIDLYNYLYSTPKEEILQRVDNIINKYQLDGKNLNGFLALRKDYNICKDPLMFYVLVINSFNGQSRFNNEQEYNSSFGKTNHYFTDSDKEDLIRFIDNIKGKPISFKISNYKDFDVNILNANDYVYCDPPYRITCAVYNDGKRGFNGWNLEDDIELMNLLDRINEIGVKFGMSNVLSQNGKNNDELIEWSKKYNVHHLNKNYKNAMYTKKVRGESDEVLITNY